MRKTNHFEEVDYGIFSEGKTLYSNQGLTYKCNEFEHNTIEVYDLFVREGTIDKVQGLCVPIDSAQSNCATNREFLKPYSHLFNKRY